jgi:hypothetical protein
MKKIAALTSLTAIVFLNMSCEKQSWEETKMFQQNRTVGEHGGHGGHGEEHGSAHKEGGEAHAPAEGAHAAPAPEKH